MFRFPWGDMHSLNLGWFLQKFNELREDWATAEENIDGALDAEIEKAEDALSDVFDARDAAAASATAAAGSATAAGTSATAAQNSATAAASSATLANQKATAAGLSEAAAAQSAAAAGNSATAAAGSATAAGQSATNAAASETAAGNSASAAAASAASIEGDVDTADAAALKSEGFSVGQQNGVDVPSTSPYYQNNAKYYAGQSGILSHIINALEKQFPSIYTPLGVLASGDFAAGNIERNILECTAGFGRIYLTGETITNIFNSDMCKIYFPSGRYICEVCILEAENTINPESSTVLLTISIVNTLGQATDFYFTKQGATDINKWYKTGVVNVAAGVYALATYVPGTSFAVTGNVKYMFRISEVDSNNDLIRGAADRDERESTEELKEITEEPKEITQTDKQV